MSLRALDISFINTLNDLFGIESHKSVVLIAFYVYREKLIIKLKGKMDVATECFFIHFY